VEGDIFFVEARENGGVDGLVDFSWGCHFRLLGPNEIDGFVKMYLEIYICVSSIRRSRSPIQ
jgi:hypothetical protein